MYYFNMGLNNAKTAKMLERDIPYDEDEGGQENLQPVTSRGNRGDTQTPS